MSRHVAAATGDRERAVELYAWNTVVSGAFYERLQGLEIALRNALHGQLTRWDGDERRQRTDRRPALSRSASWPTSARVVTTLQELSCPLYVVTLSQRDLQVSRSIVPDLPNVSTKSILQDDGIWIHSKKRGY